MQIQSSYRTAGFFTLLVAVLLFGTFVSYRATTRIAGSQHMVTHTYDVMGAIDGLILTLQRSQTAAEDFNTTGKSDYLAAYSKTSSQIPSRIDQIRTLTKDNDRQQSAIARIEGEIQQLKGNLDRAVEGRVHGQTTLLTADQQRAIGDDLRAMKAQESELLTTRSEEAAQSLMTTRLGLLMGALVNCILLGLGAYLLIRDQEQRMQIRESRLKLAAIVDSSDDAIIGKTLDGTIITFNHGAEQMYGYKSEEMVGRSIYEIVPEDRKDELRMILERLARGERIEHLETLRMRRDGGLVEMELTVSPIVDTNGKIIGASAIGRDITRRKELERSLHQLSIRILRAQDEERRRIAREIHDTTVQKLALLSMNLAQLKSPANPAKSPAMIQNSQELASECVQELRTLSYVLHPPMLDELGLASALKIYVEGIGQRSGVKITTEFEPDIPRLEPEVEMALFRVAQESVSNVLRHSGSKTATIRLKNHQGIELSVADEGTGIVRKAKASELPVTVGVGIAGMNERISQLGGKLTIDSSPKGTTVTARVPGGKAASA